MSTRYLWGRHGGRRHVAENPADYAPDVQIAWASVASAIGKYPTVCGLFLSVVDPTALRDGQDNGACLHCERELRRRARAIP